MTESALLRAYRRSVARPLLEGRSRVYRKLVIVLLALIITGYAPLSISVIGTLCLGASEPIRDLQGNFFLLSSDLYLCIPGLLPSSSNNDNLPLSPGKLNPYFVTGFADGESSFVVSIHRRKGHKTG